METNVWNIFMVAQRRENGQLDHAFLFDVFFQGSERRRLPAAPQDEEGRIPVPNEEVRPVNGGGGGDGQEGELPIQDKEGWELPI